MAMMRSLSRYSQVAKSYSHFRSVSYLILYVTSRCNLKCSMCFYADSLNAPTGDGLSVEEMIKVSKSLPHLIQLTLTGGEPFLRKDLDVIMEAFYKNSGVRSFTIPSNGSYTEKMKETLTRVCANCPEATIKIGLSLDGTKEVHNHIRGSEKSYDQIAASYAMLKEMQKEFSNLILTFTGVLNRDNLHDARDLVDLYFDRFPADDYTLQYVRGNPKDPGTKLFDAREFEHVIEYLEQRKRDHFKQVGMTRTMVRKLTTRTRKIVADVAQNNEFKVNCVAGSRLVVLYDTGILSPCEILSADTASATTGNPEDDPQGYKEKYNGFTYGDVRNFDCDVQKAVDSNLGKSIQSFIKDTKCRCTFECAIVASIFYQPKELVKTLATPSRGI